MPWEILTDGKPIRAPEWRDSDDDCFPEASDAIDWASEIGMDEGVVRLIGSDKTKAFAWAPDPRDPGVRSLHVFQAHP